MRSALLIFAFLLAACVTPDGPPSRPRRRARPTKRVAPPRAHSRVSLLAGGRRLTDEAWGDVDEQLALGFEFTRVLPSGFGIEFGALGSTDVQERASENVDVTGAVVELYFGFRQEFGSGRLHPYLAAGGSALAAGIDNDSGGVVADDEDMAPAIYGRGGFLYETGPRSFVGLDLRIVRGSELEFETVELDADYEQATFIIGLRF